MSQMFVSQWIDFPWGNYSIKRKLYMEKDELLDSAMDVVVEKDKEFSWDSVLDDDDSDDDDDETDL